MCGRCLTLVASGSLQGRLRVLQHLGRKREDQALSAGAPDSFDLQRLEVPLNKTLARRKPAAWSFTEVSQTRPKIHHHTMRTGFPWSEAPVP